VTAAKKTSKLFEKTQKMQVKIAKINKTIEEIHLRTNPIGFDRDQNEYYLVMFDLTKIYVKK